MQKRTFTTLLFMVCCMLFGQRQAWSQTYQLVWSDEFSGTSLNTANWVHETGGSGWGNNELQYYRPENTSVSGGYLSITARKESYGGRNYTSSRIKTQGKLSWQYGKIEARIQIPSGQGLWPAFWLLGDNISTVGWPACGEIDVMEHVNTETKVHGTIHWQGPDGYAQYSGSTTTTPTSWHVYSVEWTPTAIKWFVDGSLYHEANTANNINSTEEFHRPFFIILNLAVGGNWPGFTVDESRLPAQYLVDYVRVYQLGTAATTAPTGQIVWLRGSNGQYVSSENGQAPMYCNRATAQDWEKFDVVDAGGGKVALRGSNGQYVSSENGQSPMYCNRTGFGDWEKFDWIDAGNGRIALRGFNGRYVSSENGTAAMTCNRTTYDGWETFAFGTTTRTGARLAAESIAETLDVELYPNPHIRGSQLMLSLPHYRASLPVNITLTDLNGKIVWQQTAGSAQVSLPASLSLPGGIYTVQVVQGTQKMVKKLVVL